MPPHSRAEWNHAELLFGSTLNAELTKARHCDGMSGGIHSPVRGWRWLAGLVAAYLFFAIAAFELARRSDGIAFVWPASGIAVAGLLMLTRKHRTTFLMSIAAASVAANLMFGASLGIAVGFTLANLVECLVARKIAISGRVREISFDSPAWVARFAGGAATSSVMSATIATVTVGPAAATLNFVLSWAFTVFLGILIVTPAVITLRRSSTGARIPSLDRPMQSKVAVYVVVALLTVVTFGQNVYPLLFLPFAAVLLATYSLGVSGAVVTVFLVAVVGSIATSRGAGPMHFIDGNQERIVFFQFFLVVLLASALPLASLLARSRASASLLRQSNRLLETAERTAGVGHWRHELGTHDVIWSEEVARIHGRDAGTRLVRTGQAISAYHPADRPSVRIGLRVLLASGSPFAFDGRIVRPDGAVRHVETHAEVERDDTGTMVALIGVVVDVTARVEAVTELQLEKVKAERNAEDATTLSRTDDLTGIANRRRLMEALEHDVALEGASRRPLAFVMFDLDNFKLINDRFGHGVGDRVLRAVTQDASRCLPDGATLGRMGGEEFGILLPGVDRDEALALASRLRASVERCWSGDYGLERVTASFGVALLGRNENAIDLLRAADIALYAAKERGRNRVEVADARSSSAGPARLEQTGKR